MPVKIFFCYAHEDELLLTKLKAHLIPLQRAGLIDIWHDRDISAGTEWEKEISQQLNTAQIILLLVSPDFMNSDYCYSIEMMRAMKRHEHGEAQVIPIILRPVYWHEAPFGKLQALPKDAQPVTSSRWQNWDEAFFDVAESISKVLMQLPRTKSLSVQGRVNIRDMSDEEKLSRTAILTKLRQLYVLSHDNISPGIMAGTEPLPKEWVEEQLEKMGETWRQDTYLPQQQIATGKQSFNGKGSDTRIVKLKSGVAIFRLKYQGEDIPTFYLNDEDDRVISRLNATKLSVLTVPITGRQKTVKIKTDGVYLLKVRASGSWEVEIEQ